MNVAMELMSISPKPGMRARAHEIFQYPLPPELKEGDPLTVVTGIDHGYCKVRDDADREHRLFVGAIELRLALQSRWRVGDRRRIS